MPWFGRCATHRRQPWLVVANRQARRELSMWGSRRRPRTHVFARRSHGLFLHRTQANPQKLREPRQRARSALPAADADRKSTRLNSSHLVISYAVFCLKKKKKQTFILHCSDQHRSTPYTSPCCIRGSAHHSSSHV